MLSGKIGGQIESPPPFKVSSGFHFINSTYFYMYWPQFSLAPENGGAGWPTVLDGSTHTHTHTQGPIKERTHSYK